MIPKMTYINNLRMVFAHRRTKGVIVECGTWRGGMIAGMVKILGLDRSYYLFDSFQGLPDVGDIDGQDAKRWQENKDGEFYFNNCLATEQEADEAMKLVGAKDYFIKKGWFNETLPRFKPSEGIAVLRLDGDWYESTMECLVHLFPQVNKGGLIIIDDYYMWEGCAKAVHDYLSKNQLSNRILSFKNICYLVK